ncbi:GNAT family N-acetyltransferase [Clostridium sp. D2Q-14]|uniref:GNAT family N-acetyltransferase n=1 Tax=Anaeromonas gelatinilytica TaxID=2683194 RepID=UPI00193B3E1C|nr:GNAT family N-acetyltransferase [Anaeromonas gelatinilytica]MBS4535302.1 GNAT family N-acetyltransferase [Anaeromonas gelatinilytica]
MDIEFKVMDQEDVTNVYEFFQDLKEETIDITFADINSKDEIENMVRDEDVFIYTAYYKNEIAGVFRGIRGKGNKNHSVFLTAAIPKRLRGKRIAQKLTDFGLDDMRNKGIRIARAYVYSDNNSSVSTLLKQGFTFSGCVNMHHYDDKENRYVDDLIFHKIL